MVLLLIFLSVTSMKLAVEPTTQKCRWMSRMDRESVWGGGPNTNLKRERLAVGCWDAEKPELARSRDVGLSKILGRTSS